MILANTGNVQEARTERCIVNKSENLYHRILMTLCWKMPALAIDAEADLYLLNDADKPQPAMKPLSKNQMFLDEFDLCSLAAVSLLSGALTPTVAYTFIIRG